MKTKTIRGLDESLYQKARIASIQNKVTLGEWINRAIKAFLK